VIEDLIKEDPNFKPPADYRPRKYSVKIRIPQVRSAGTTELLGAWLKACAGVLLGLHSVFGELRTLSMLLYCTIS
jgi:hypothetical protein